MTGVMAMLRWRSPFGGLADAGGKRGSRTQEKVQIPLAAYKSDDAARIKMVSGSHRRVYLRLGCRAA
ncbi:hypothetical protein SPHINGO391_490249 [Sphingomonas aurantiaca]|uniref:Uncharacterized protein n=1 Tax=Sphingomonas aurantiaca TaxID=185949 RepID=A0A5E8ABQ4_9SPHN|nr:hypothetical protein SPHINGO391_490249 [Sphingomonas aurantiaca]